MKMVSGTVTDAATGQPLAGVIVEAYGNHRYTSMTDDKGGYELKVPEYVNSVSMRVEGYQLLQKAIGTKTSQADAQLYPSSFSPVYQSATQASVSRSAQNFDNTARLSIDPLVAEQLGADIHSVSRSGQLGMGNTMFIGGITSLQTNAQPLVVIDGVITDMQYDRQMLHEGYYNNILANLNVNDIESVTVLKNGTAIYGAKAAAGVLLIKTKRNRSMATKIDVTINGQYQLMPRRPKMMGAEDYRLYATEMLSGLTSNVKTLEFVNSDPTNYYYKSLSTAIPPTIITTPIIIIPTGRTRFITTPSCPTTASTCRVVTTWPTTTSRWATPWAMLRCVATTSRASTCD